MNKALNQLGESLDPDEQPLLLITLTKDSDGEIDGTGIYSTLAMSPNQLRKLKAALDSWFEDAERGNPGTRIA